MCTHNQCFRAKKEKYYNFSSENYHFQSENYYFHSGKKSPYIAWVCYRIGAVESTELYKLVTISSLLPKKYW